jgi:hypothetical protein
VTHRRSVNVRGASPGQCDTDIDTDIDTGTGGTGSEVGVPKVGPAQHPRST